MLKCYLSVDNHMKSTPKIGSKLVNVEQLFKVGKNLTQYNLQIPKVFGKKFRLHWIADTLLLISIIDFRMHIVE